MNTGRTQRVRPFWVATLAVLCLLGFGATPRISASLSGPAGAHVLADTHPGAGTSAAVHASLHADSDVVLRGPRTVSGGAFLQVAQPLADLGVAALLTGLGAGLLLLRRPREGRLLSGSRRLWPARAPPLAA